MGREQGTFKFAANLEIEKGAPLDSRMLVQNISDLTDSGAIWNAKDGKKYLFNGLIVSVTEDNNLYMLIDAENYTDINSWKRVGSSTINLTYSELVELRENSRLIPGCKYRITDYVTTTSQINTQSAGHQFDIIVEALSEYTLSENAKAMLDENDGYFDDVNLNAWEIKYCLDNSIERFAWADTTNGKGVIYYMKDEWGNECPYDFKNIQFYREEQDKYLFTFSWINENDEVEDLTLRQDLLSDEMIAYGTHDNTIKSYYQDDSLLCLALNDIVFINTYEYDGGLFYGCYNNAFGNGCYNNTFGNGCYNNTFGNGCYNNAFGNGCYNNTFGNGCYNNTFGEDCCYNTFGEDCCYNTFGEVCYHNTFGDNCCYNTFGEDCCYNTFGNNCQWIAFYDNADYTYKNSKFTYGGEELTFITNIFLDNGCSYLLFYTSKVIGKGNKIQNITVTKGIKGKYGSNGLLTLEIPVTNNEYELKIARNVNGDIKMYCEANLIK